MLNIGFIFPSSEYLHDPFRGDPHTHFQILTVLESYFKDRISAQLIDLRGIKREFALYHIPECDVYLHSVYTLDFKEQVSIVKNLRLRYPRAKHIAGGPHAAVFQNECMEVFDALIIGDGEEIVLKAVQDMLNLKLEKIYRQDSRIDINAYPYPSRKYLPKSTVSRPGLVSTKDKDKGYENLLSTTVIFSRGCPYKCHFCHMPETKEMGLGIRFRKPEYVEEEIEYLKKEYDIKAVSLLDEICLPLSREKATAHLEAIGRTGIIWKGQCRADGVTDETARLCRDAGCAVMCMGIESVSQRSLDIINKKISVEQARNSIRILKKNGIEVRVYMIVGLPGEPEDIVEKTWSFIQETGPDLVYLSFMTVRPGTEMFKHPEKFGFKWINTADPDKTMHMYSRYGDERPALTFEYAEDAPWGKPPSGQRIVENYLELQSRLKESGLCVR